MNLAEANQNPAPDRRSARARAARGGPATRDKYLRIIAAELAEAERADDATVQSTVEMVLITLVDT
jgi:hypothetical protein